jgi:hypothetical protein
VRRAVSQKALHLLRRGWQADQIEVSAAEQGAFVGGGTGSDGFLVEFGCDEGIDRISRRSSFGNGRTQQLLKSPMLPAWGVERRLFRGARERAQPAGDQARAATEQREDSSLHPGVNPLSANDARLTGYFHAADGFCKWRFGWLRDVVQ